jgi:transcriptional regulator with XRE-family HTH domain
VNLRAARLNRGLSVREAAKEIGVKPSTLRRAEHGDGVHPGTAKKIADYYGVRVTDIWPLPDPDPDERVAA